MDKNIIKEGVELMTVGMSVVFAFLILLVLFMTISGALFQKFAHRFPENPPKDPSSPRPADDTPAKVAIAIAAAHRTKYDR